MPIPYRFNCYSLISELEIRKHDAFAFDLLSQDCSGYLDCFVIVYNFRIACSVSVKQATEILIDCTESVDCFVHYGHINNTNSSNPFTRDIFPFTCVFFNFFY